MKIDLNILIDKFIENKLLNHEYDILEEYLRIPENRIIFDELVEVHYLVSPKSIHDLDSLKAYNKIFPKVRGSRFGRKTINKIMKYAAVLVIAIGIGGYYSGIFQKEVVPAMSLDNVITLKLENGETKIIQNEAEESIVNNKGNVLGVQKGNIINYKNNSTEEETLVYHTLKVPYGEQFQLVLSDGSHIKLNAGTSLKYPVRFIKGKNRQVYLIGEAFFDVAEDKEHPFVVNTDELNVRVLGTKFNIASYPEDQNVNAVLIEGSVSVYSKDSLYNEDTTLKIKPGFKAILDKNSHEIAIGEADIELHTAWLNGRIIFKHLPFKNIIKKLERHYNVVIINNNRVLENEYFSSSFDIETIEEVFLTFSKTYKIDFKIIDDNKIIIY